MVHMEGGREWCKEVGMWLWGIRREPDRGTRKWVCGCEAQGTGQRGTQASGYVVIGHREGGREGCEDMGML